MLGGVIEFGGAIALALGVGSRLAGSALFGDQVMAMITVTWANGINSESLTPGYEFNVALAVMALVIVFLGPGRVSIDALIERRLESIRIREGAVSHRIRRLDVARSAPPRRSRRTRPGRTDHGERHRRLRRGALRARRSRRTTCARTR